MSYPSILNPAVSSAITSAINSNNSSVVVPGDQLRSNAIVTTTWADRATAIAAIAAKTPANGLVYVSDITINGSLWYCDGVNMIPLDSNMSLFGFGVPVLIPPTGSIANNGALTLGTALQETLSGGCYMFFGANVIAAGVAAGLYYCIMSSTTVGTIYNNTYTTGIPQVVTSPTAFVTTGPGAYTQTITEQTLIHFTLPGGLMGKNGSLRSNHFAQQNNTAGTKTIRVKFGGTTAYNAGLGTGTLSAMNMFCDFLNRGATNSQLCTASNATNGTSVTAQDLVKMTKDTTIDQVFSITGQIAAATDWLVIEGVVLTLVKGA